VQHLIRWVIAHGEFAPEANEVLQQILAQEITPELIPTEEGVKPQATEDSTGPYALQDFTLFHVLRHGMRPSRVAFLAWHAWRNSEVGEWPPGFGDGTRPAYDLAEIRHWLDVFIRKFFASQFKRSALPNGPKVSAGGTMSPRGDWRMPSDASRAAWLKELDNVPTQ
jgi:NAD+ synthase (glutamine-hydrolysing)